ncbi:hypothetical protein [Cellulomonas bogoriensis]|uniref:hypothetical protein n=1 Tax=Cellulomonas bogoriensis TaxID=301388 RepID=UPI0012EBBFDB|nr:hypothetical protein [Cellulomonas bogoriensis]
MDRLFLRSMRARWRGEVVGVRVLDDERVLLLYDADPRWAAEQGMRGDQYSGWELEVPFVELTDVTFREIDSAWSDTGRVPPLGVRAVYRGHEYGARWDQGSGVVTLHLGMGDPVPASGETLGRRGRDGRVVRVPVRFVSRVFTRSASAVWQGEDVWMEVLDRRHVRVRMFHESRQVSYRQMAGDADSGYVLDVEFLEIRSHQIHEHDHHVTMKEPR